MPLEVILPCTSNITCTTLEALLTLIRGVRIDMPQNVPFRGHPNETHLASKRLEMCQEMLPKYSQLIVMPFDFVVALT